ncbi:MAG: glycosyltransferase [Saprospiraceae bacterium]
MIPRIIHQTAPSISLPDQLLQYSDHLRTMHPTWEYRLYDDKACAQLVKQSFPELIEIYDAVPYNIMRADIFRILAVYLYGGFYFDLDVYFHKPIDELIVHHAVFAKELVLNEKDLALNPDHHPIRIANYGFGSEPGNPFFLAIIQYWLLNKGKLLNIKSENDILEITGPGMLTRLYHSYFAKRTSEMLLLDLGSHICPKCNHHQCQFGDFASHQHLGTWRWKI